jgi:hypothetical protein
MNNFDWQTYIRNYEDLQNAGINTRKKAWHHWINHGKLEGRIYSNAQNISPNNIKPVIFCIAKLEHDYIEEFVKYHLALGFDMIYIYDNEDQPTYAKLLEKYSNYIKVIHFKGSYMQYPAIEHFVKNFMHKNNITHVANIDIDEFIVLKSHPNIKDFISEYIVGNCAGIGMNWRFFGSSNHTEKTNEPQTIKFTMCQENGNPHIKTLFNVKYFEKYNTMHDIIPKINYHIKTTNGHIIEGPFNNNIDLSIIQLNHYKTKTLPEFQYIRTRGQADIKSLLKEDVVANFNTYNLNEIEDLVASNFYKNVLNQS